MGADQDNIDAYLGPHLKSDKVFIINQVDADTKKFDEHKVIFGAGSLRQAILLYEKAFSDGRGLQRIGSVVSTTIPEFKKWLSESNTTKVFAHK